ncbi:hypothetical protein quinque_011226 [Culex quinquefasciatus]
MYSTLLLYSLVLLMGLASAKRISELNCQKYADKNIRISWAAPLVIDPEPIPLKAPNCSDSIDLIVNGEEAGEGEFPHQAVLGYASNETGNIGGYQFLCGDR